MANGDPLGMTPLAAPPSRVQTSSQQSTQSAAQQVVAAFAAANQSNMSGGTNDPMVFLGTKEQAGTGPIYGGQGHMHGEPTDSTIDNTMPLSQVAGEYYSWDQKTKDKFLTQLALAGYDTSSMTDDKLASAWASYAQQAANYLQNGVKLTPWDVMSKDMIQREKAQSKPRTVTQTQTTTNLSTSQDAHALFLQAAQSLLGRDPTSSETTSFRNALNAYERAHPSVSTTTSKYAGGDLTSQSTQTTGGVDDAARQDMAMEDIKKDPEYGAYQAATTYFNSLMQMVGGVK